MSQLSEKILKDLAAAGFTEMTEYSGLIWSQAGRKKYGGEWPNHPENYALDLAERITDIYGPAATAGTPKDFGTATVRILDIPETLAKLESDYREYMTGKDILSLTLAEDKTRVVFGQSGRKSETMTMESAMRQVIDWIRVRTDSKFKSFLAALLTGRSAADKPVLDLRRQANGDFTMRTENGLDKSGPLDFLLLDLAKTINNLQLDEGQRRRLGNFFNGLPYDHTTLAQLYQTGDGWFGRVENKNLNERGVGFQKAVHALIEAVAEYAGLKVLFGREGEPYIVPVGIIRDEDGHYRLNFDLFAYKNDKKFIDLFAELRRSCKEIDDGSVLMAGLYQDDGGYSVRGAIAPIRRYKSGETAAKAAIDRLIHFTANLAHYPDPAGRVDMDVLSVEGETPEVKRVFGLYRWPDDGRGDYYSFRTESGFSVMGNFSSIKPHLQRFMSALERTGKTDPAPTRPERIAAADLAETDFKNFLKTAGKPTPVDRMAELIPNDFDKAGRMVVGLFDYGQDGHTFIVSSELPGKRGKALYTSKDVAISRALTILNDYSGPRPENPNDIKFADYSGPAGSKDDMVIAAKMALDPPGTASEAQELPGTTIFSLAKVAGTETTFEITGPNLPAVGRQYWSGEFDAVKALVGFMSKWLDELYRDQVYGDVASMQLTAKAPVNIVPSIAVGHTPGNQWVIKTPDGSFLPGRFPNLLNAVAALVKWLKKNFPVESDKFYSLEAGRVVRPEPAAVIAGILRYHSIPTSAAKLAGLDYIDDDNFSDLRHAKEIEETADDDQEPEVGQE